MDRGMDGWMDGWIDGWIDGYIFLFLVQQTFDKKANSANKKKGY